MIEPGGARLRRLAGAAVAVLLVAGTIALAGPETIGDLLAATRIDFLLWALAAAAGSLVFRGLRLAFLLPPGTLAPLRAVGVAAVAQAAAVFVPARLGELALPWLLRRDTGRDGASSVATMLVARTLDTAALGTWGGIAILVRWGLDAPIALAAAAALLLPAVLLPTGIAVIDRWLTARARAAGRWADRVHRVSSGLDDARRRPLRLALAAAACLISWAFQWTLAWCLLAAMGLRWPAWDVVTGSAVASVSNLLPFNLVGNLGTLEAGWTAAFATMGYPVDVAAASGLASHLWALVFAAVFGAVGWLALGGSRRPGGVSDLPQP